MEFLTWGTENGHTEVIQNKLRIINFDRALYTYIIYAIHNRFWETNYHSSTKLVTNY